MGQPSAKPIFQQISVRRRQEAEAEISVAGTLLSPQELEVAVVAIWVNSMVDVEIWDIHG